MEFRIKEYDWRLWMGTGDWNIERDLYVFRNLILGLGYVIQIEDWYIGI